VRFAQDEQENVAVAVRPFALVRLLRRQTGEQHFASQLAAELFTASLFALLCALHGATWQTLWLMLACSFFVLITVMDYKYRLVLNVLTYPGIVLALVVNLAVLRQPILNIGLGVAFAFGIFYITTLLRSNGLGGGDVKLAALIGAAFGFPQVLVALIASAVASAAAIGFLLISRQRGIGDSIPYAPFLCLGAVIALVYNTAMVI
jgi:leader peptidase (prepilin peptidase)/N-methyltransferase